jgi:hypothetical protein
LVVIENPPHAETEARMSVRGKAGADPGLAVAA